MQEIFRFRQTGMSADHQVLGKFEATGIRPRFVDHLTARGVSLPNEIFRPETRLD